MFHYITKYSFDPTKEVSEGFHTEVEAWAAMQKSANAERLHDVKECGYQCEYTETRDSGEIILKNVTDGSALNGDVTEFFIIKIQ